MNSLGSWIDKAELDRLVEAVGTGPLKKAEAAANEQAAQKGSWPGPAGASAPAPAQPPTDDKERFPVAEEVEKFRNKVAAIKDKARNLGVLKPAQHPTEQPAAPPIQPSAETDRQAEIAPEPPSSVAPSAPQEPSHPEPEPARHVPDTGPLASKAPPPRSLPSFTPPEGSLPEQLDAYGKWVTSLTYAQALLISDAQGDILFAHRADASWSNAVTTAAAAAEQVGRQLSIPGPNVLHMDLPGDRKLAVLQLKLRSASINIGMVLPRQLDPDLSLAIAGTLVKMLTK